MKVILILIQAESIHHDFTDCLSLDGLAEMIFIITSHSFYYEEANCSVQATFKSALLERKYLGILF